MSGTTMIPTWAARLAADLLREYSDRRGNDGCNDYDLPDWVPREEFMTQCPGANNEPNMTREDMELSCQFNHCVVDVVAYVLYPSRSGEGGK